MKNPQRVVDSNFDRLQARNNLVSKNQSQMNKLLPMLELRAKKGDADSQIKAKLELRAKALVELKAKLEKATVKVSKLYVVEKPEQLKRLTSALKSVSSIMENRPPVGVSKALKACVNELTSLREGVYVGAAVDKKTLSILACTNAVKQVETLIEATKKKIENVGKDEQDVMAAAEEQSYQEIEKVLEMTQKESQNIDQLHKRPFVLTRVPVIPLSKGPLNVSVLQKVGFKTDMVSGYTVMHNQLVLGVNKQMLELKKGGISRVIDTKVVLDKALEVKKMVEKQTGAKYQFVTEKPYGASGGAWFWLMTERDLNLFAKSFPGGHVKLERWGFAF